MLASTRNPWTFFFLFHLCWSVNKRKVVNMESSLAVSTPESLPFRSHFGIHEFTQIPWWAFPLFILKNDLRLQSIHLQLHITSRWRSSNWYIVLRTVSSHLQINKWLYKLYGHFTFEFPYGVRYFTRYYNDFKNSKDILGRCIKKICINIHRYSFSLLIVRFVDLNWSFLSTEFMNRFYASIKLGTFRVVRGIASFPIHLWIDASPCTHCIVKSLEPSKSFLGVSTKS